MTTRQRTTEDRATQPLVCWKAKFRNKKDANSDDDDDSEDND